MRYWHNEVEKTAPGPSVRGVYHFIGTNLINKIWYGIFLQSFNMKGEKSTCVLVSFSRPDYISLLLKNKNKLIFSSFFFILKVLQFLTEVSWVSEHVNTQIFLQPLKILNVTNTAKASDVFPWEFSFYGAAWCVFRPPISGICVLTINKESIWKQPIYIVFFAWDAFMPIQWLCVTVISTSQLIPGYTYLKQNPNPLDLGDCPVFL